MKGICQSGSQLHHYFPFFASGAKRQPAFALPLFSFLHPLPSDPTAAAAAAAACRVINFHQTRSLSLCSEEFFPAASALRSVDVGEGRGRGARFGGLFREGIFSQNSCEEVGERAGELGVQGPDKTRRGDLPLPPPEGRKKCKAGGNGKKVSRDPAAYT